MLKQIRLRQAGGSVSATIPKDMAERLNVAAGDEVFIAETDEGILITPYDETTRQAVASGRQIAKRYRNALRELAR